MEAKIYRGGAPKKSDQDKRERRVEIRYKTDEYKQIVRRKESTMLPDIASFIRAVSLDQPIRMRPQLSTQEEKVLSLVRETRQDMLRIGVNINQSAKRINSTTDYHDLQREINSMSAQMTQLDVQLREIMVAVLRAQPANQVNLNLTDGGTNQ